MSWLRSPEVDKCNALSRTAVTAVMRAAAELSRVRLVLLTPTEPYRPEEEEWR